MIPKKWKIEFENKIVEQLIFRYFNIHNFEISKYRSFCISSFQILIPTQLNVSVEGKDGKTASEYKQFDCLGTYDT